MLLHGPLQQHTACSLHRIMAATLPVRQLCINDGSHTTRRPNLLAQCGPGEVAHI